MSFEAFTLADRKLEPADRLECGICWYVYDPASGDEVWDVPPGVAFSDLPAHWRCPRCDAPRDKFMKLVTESAGGGIKE